MNNEVQMATQKDVIRKLKQAGFIIIPGGKGSHVKMKQPDKNITTLVPQNKSRDIPIGTIRQIERATGVSLR